MKKKTRARGNTVLKIEHLMIENTKIDVEVQRKHIKNMYLRVKSPSGNVCITAPPTISIERIQRFADERADWIIKQQQRIVNRPEIDEKSVDRGDTIYLWGEQYTLGTDFSGVDEKKREHYIREWYREQLKSTAAELVPKWENITGLYCDEWRTKYMKTRWGTCNTRERRIWLNVRLAQYSKQCLEYVILHELVHLRVPNHGEDFKLLMDRYMPEWREVRKMMN